MKLKGASILTGFTVIQIQIARESTLTIIVIQIKVLKFAKNCVKCFEWISEIL